MQTGCGRGARALGPVARGCWLGHGEGEGEYEWAPLYTTASVHEPALPFPLVTLLCALGLSGALNVARISLPLSAHAVTLLRAQGLSGALNVARMRLTMDAAPAPNSSACLAERTCLPLGGHSVAAVLPPLRNATGSEVGWPVVPGA